MFGFLKEKLNNFGQKLKSTISGKEEETKKEEPKAQIDQEKPIEKQKEEKKEAKIEKKETPKQEPKKNEEVILTKELEITEVKEDLKPEEKKLEEKLFKEIEEEIKKEDNEKAKQKVDTKVEEKKKETDSKKETTKQTENKKEGILTKLFGIGKKEDKQKHINEEKKKEVERVKEKPKIETIEELKTEKKEKELKEEIKEVTKAIKEETITPKVNEEEVLEENIEDTLVEDKTISENERIIEQDKRIEERRKELLSQEIKKANEDKRELKAEVGVFGGIKGLVFGGVEIKEKEIEDLLWELELSLLESDVEQDAAHELTTQIKKRLIGQKVSAKNIDEFLQEQIKEILKSMMTTEKINLFERIKNKKEKPYRILILGPNGAGKTTSIAKLTHLLEKHKMTAVWAAADTFRAAAIDQLEEHSKKLGVRMIKQQYGADPAAVAFDAIKAAEANKNDVVLIDSAGRQETNKNLMEELRKIERVAKPDLKLYVGESYAGQGLLEQAKEFDEMAGIDGFILTKIDTDAKGGTAISLLYKMKKPILFVGTGQGYSDFEEFTEDFIINRII